MKKWRCAKDIFGYCEGTPKWLKRPKEREDGYVAGGECRLNPSECGKYQTFSTQIGGE